MVVIEIH